MTRLLLVLAVALGFTSIPVLPPLGQNTFPDKTIARIIISQDKQQMLIYEGKTLVRALPISTGWPGLRKTSTPAWSGKIGEFWGTFESFGTTQDLGYWLFTDRLGDGSWNGDILIHGAPYNFGPEGEKVYSTAQIGVVPASHGCIQLLPEDAEWFHRWDPIGVPIMIESFSGGTLIYPKIVFGAQLAGSAGVQGHPAPANTNVVTEP
jgi:lipoprotein-anchoring transpeptidase ErfK/SrfK